MSRDPHWKLAVSLDTTGYPAWGVCATCKEPSAAGLIIETGILYDSVGEDGVTAVTICEACLQQAVAQLDEFHSAEQEGDG